MSRVAKRAINLPKGVELKEADGVLSVKGPKGTLNLAKPVILLRCASNRLPSKLSSTRPQITYCMRLSMAIKYSSTVVPSMFQGSCLTHGWPSST